MQPIAFMLYEVLALGNKTLPKITKVKVAPYHDMKAHRGHLGIVLSSFNISAVRGG
jgi:hypothetical protein